MRVTVNLQIKKSKMRNDGNALFMWDVQWIKKGLSFPLAFLYWIRIGMKELRFYLEELKKLGF